MTLRRQANLIDNDPTIAQRIKRRPSIAHKLERIPGMKLSRMHDIGGCRAVVSSVTTVAELVSYYKGGSRLKHKLVREDPYIAKPKESGYRSHHLVYSYYSDKDASWNGLRIEIQIRSRLQHAWATAVETVGTSTRQALKSSWGDEAWLRFFTLMSSAMAVREDTPLVPGTPTAETARRRELRRLAKELDVVNRLTTYGAALQYTEAEASKKGHIFLLELNVREQTLSSRAYTDALLAAEDYNAIERAIEGDPEKDAVLVTVESLATLRSRPVSRGK